MKEHPDVIPMPGVRVAWRIIQVPEDHPMHLPLNGTRNVPAMVAYFLARTWFEARVLAFRYYGCEVPNAAVWKCVDGSLNELEECVLVEANESGELERTHHNAHVRETAVSVEP